MESRGSRQLLRSPEVACSTVDPRRGSSVGEKRVATLRSKGLCEAAFRAIRASPVSTSGASGYDAPHPAPLKRRRVRGEEEPELEPTASCLLSSSQSPVSAVSGDVGGEQAFTTPGNPEQLRADAPRGILVKNKDADSGSVESRTEVCASHARASAKRTGKRVSVQENPERVSYEACTTCQSEDETGLEAVFPQLGSERAPEGGRTGDAVSGSSAGRNRGTSPSPPVQETGRAKQKGSDTSSDDECNRPPRGPVCDAQEEEKLEEPESPVLSKRVPNSFPLTNVDLPASGLTSQAFSSAAEPSFQTPFCSPRFSPYEGTSFSSPAISAGCRARGDGALQFVPPPLRRSVVSCLRHFGPERRPQLLRICSLLGDLTSPVPVIEVLGLPGTGKTSLLLSFFSSSSLAWGYVDCASSALSVAGGGRLAVRQAVCGRLLLGLAKHLRREVHAGLKSLRAAQRRLEMTKRENDEEARTMGERRQDGKAGRASEGKDQSVDPRAHTRVGIQNADIACEDEDSAGDRESDAEDHKAARPSSLSPPLHKQASCFSSPSYSRLFSGAALASLISDLMEKKQELEKLWRSLRAGKRSSACTQLSSVERFTSLLRQLLRCSSPLCRDRSVVLVIDEVSFLGQNMPDLLHALLRLPELMGGEASCHQELVDDPHTAKLSCLEDPRPERELPLVSQFFSPSLETKPGEPYLETARDRRGTEEATTGPSGDSSRSENMPNPAITAEPENCANLGEGQTVGDPLHVFSARAGRTFLKGQSGDLAAGASKVDKTAFERELLLRPSREVCVLLVGHAPLRDEIHLGLATPPRVVFEAYNASEAASVLTREFEALGLDMLQLAAIQQKRQDRFLELPRRAARGPFPEVGSLSERLRLEEQVGWTAERLVRTESAMRKVEGIEAVFPADSTPRGKRLCTRRLVLRRVRRRLKKREGTQGWATRTARVGGDEAEPTQAVSCIGRNGPSREESELPQDGDKTLRPEDSRGVCEGVVQTAASQTGEEIDEEDEVVLDVRLLWKHFVKHFTQTFHRYIRSDFHEQRFLCREFWGQAMSLLLLEDRGAGDPALAAAVQAATKAARCRAHEEDCSFSPARPVPSRLANVEKEHAFSPVRCGSSHSVTATVTSPEAIAAASVAAISVLVKLLNPHFRVALRNPFTRFLPDLQDCQVLDRVHVTVWGAAALDRDTAARRIELPRLGKVLLVAACVAAYTPSSRDKRTFNDTFGNFFRVMRPRRAPLLQSPLIAATARSKREWNADTSDIFPRALPKTFTLTRWLALAECIGGEGLGLTRAGVNQQITTLLRLGAVRIASGSAVSAGGGYGALGVLRLTEQSRGVEWTDPLGWVVQQQQLLGPAYKGRGADIVSGGVTARSPDGDLGDLLNPNTRLALQAPLGLVRETANSLGRRLGDLLTV
ncbi:origin recognition complex subunit 5 [Cystoisospora suis]|uniref:Origin recognition complex subunit 5 n=1 Tax=Cystoisospora suis TaxID=483139 RepID=A0A2C6LCC2_9APIC|nr:origin recognition complex subunit 5 [Cystoisospora suis]